jgi:eukaryotic-like serine/threonine-protein kinase
MAETSYQREQQLRQACAELRGLLHSGEPGAAETVFARHPALVDDTESALEILYTEWITREELGQDPSPGELFLRFPQWQERLKRLLEVHAGMLAFQPAAFAPATIHAEVEPHAAALDEPPDRLGAYDVLEPIGRGGMGIVFKARHRTLGREVAVKRLLGGPFAEAEELARFHTEAAAAAHLDHPNIVKIFEVGEQHGEPYLILELVDGGSLADLLAKGPLPPRDAAELVETLARAVDHAHQRGVLHRDLKPGNVLLSHAAHRDAANPLPAIGELQPKIGDFGLCKRIDVGSDVTQTGNLIGTPAYLAPERIDGGNDGAAADVYSLGAIFYECLTGRPPFLADSPLATLSLVRESDPVPPTVLQPGCPADAATICLHCLQKDPQRRYASAGELADDLRRFLNGEPIHARPIGTLGRLAKWVRRRPTTASLLAVTALAASLLIVVLIVSNVQIREKQQQTADALHSTTEARNDLAASLDRERRTQYLHRVRLAYMSWQEANLVQAEAFLEACRPKPGQKDLRGWEWRYLKRLCHPELLFVRTDGNSSASALAFSPDGRLFAAVQRDQTVIVREVASGKVLFALPGMSPGRRPDQLSFSPDGRFLVFAGSSNFLKVCSVADSRVVRSLRGNHFAFGPDGRRLAAVDLAENTVRIYDAHSGSELRSRHVPLAGFGAFAYCRDGLWLACALPNKRSVQVWNGETGKKRLELQSPLDVTRLAFASNGRRLAAGYNYGTVKLWDLTRGAAEPDLARYPAPIHSLVFSPDGLRLAVGDAIGTLNVVDVKQRDLLTIRGQLRGVSAVAFSPDGRRLASAAVRRLAVSDITRDPETRVFRGHRDYVGSLAFDGEGRLASVGGSGRVKVWVPDTGRVVLDLPARLGPLEQVAYNAAGNRWLTLNRAGQGRMWGAAGRELRAFPAPKGRIRRAAAVSADGACLASLDDGNAIQLWDWSSGRLRCTLSGHTDKIYGVAFSPDGRRLASAGYDRTVRLWDTATGRELFTLPGHEGPVPCLAFSWDGGRLATGGVDTLIRVWDVRSGRQVIAIHNRYGRNLVNAIAFSPDGRRLASSGYDATVTLWDVETGEEALTLRCPRMAVGVLAFSPDGRRLAAASNDGSITVWDAP